MSRQLRFMAYCNVDKIMYCDIQRGITFEDKSFYSFQDFIEGTGYHDWILYQYIGVDDVGGRPIYEGHIVKCRDEEGRESTHKIIYCGNYKYPAFDITPPNTEDASNGIHYFSEFGSIEIIGHVKTHSELISGFEDE